ncbi:MAG TPA: bifunctional N-acetylglucosamine-1-phosphate uridyltransferase/glucosamine-1-phosphate acetyltransferase [Planctomycetes bacterium]|nr:bifunctional N-acetylglucosamine-1-phosphate uridyltransferase/glucosamine-1-phosphate acetyltransferase [Planctomycetota bacterium]HIL37719.1 bifunctional N-acetylglucosamine-1-phosphate uridyltransferase/glucosamine-1-phosphate acetyltransferase [Planctomycetota bacterium]
MSSLTVLVLAAGQSKRMHSALPKVLHSLLGRPLLGWVLETALELDPERIVLVTGPEGDAIEEAAREMVGERCELLRAVQDPPRGTGDAVRAGLDAVSVEEGAEQGVVLVLYGDMPLVRASSLSGLLQIQAGAGAGSMALLTAELADPRGYGRIQRDEEGVVIGIVEERDCSEEQRLCYETNPGLYVFDTKALLEVLPQLSSDNSQGEYYLTDVVELFVKANRRVVDLMLDDAEEATGVNSLEQMAEARWALQARILEQHLANGVRIEDPSTTMIDCQVEIGQDTVIQPFCVLRRGVRIGAGCEVGPFAHMRTGAVLKDGAVFGNFCEIKNSTIGPGSKVKHLSYLGDVTIGTKANVGAGTIFANYDGQAKHPSKVGDGAFVGSGTLIVAPNEVPAGATTAAGAVLTKSASMAPGEVWAGVPARRLGASKKSKEDTSSVSQTPQKEEGQL